MFSQIQLIATGVILVILLAIGWSYKSLYDENMECRINTKIAETKHKADVKRHEKDKLVIVEEYDKAKDELDKFKRRKNETDCEASRRFFNDRDYD